MEQLKNILKKNLSSSRFNHSLSVGKLARVLGKKHGWDPELAYQTGLLHDCAKEWSPAELYRYSKRHKLKIPDLNFIRRTSPNLMHAYVGAKYAKQKGWLKNKSALKAIESHTLGSLTMTLPEKIIYVADFASYDRVYKKAKEVRREALRNLEKGFRLALRYKIQSNLRRFKAVHPFAIAVWNSHVSN